MEAFKILSLIPRNTSKMFTYASENNILYSSRILTVFLTLFKNIGNFFTGIFQSSFLT